LPYGDHGVPLLCITTDTLQHALTKSTNVNLSTEDDTKHVHVILPFGGSTRVWERGNRCVDDAQSDGGREGFVLSPKFDIGEGMKFRRDVIHLQ
jgi:hypothetical protein